MKNILKIPKCDQMVTKLKGKFFACQLQFGTIQEISELMAEQTICEGVN